MLSVGQTKWSGQATRQGKVTLMNATTIDAPNKPMNTNKRLDTLIAEHPFLAGMSSEHLKILTESAMFSEFIEDQLIFSEGDPANRFYLILEGEIALES